MGILRSDRVSGLGGANAIKGSVFFNTNDNSNYNENLAVTNTSDLDIGAGNYTIEYWFNCVDSSSDGFNTSVALSEYTNTSSNSAFNIYHYNKGFRIFNRTGGGFVELSNPTDKWIPSRWHHFAWVRSGTGTNENAIYVDGVSIDTFTNAVNYTSGQHWLIGANFYTGSNGYGVNPEYGFSGHLSNVRISNIARYSGAFTPPTAEFSVDSNTILLACQSPSNILQEATGKEVTFYKGYIANSPPQASRFTPNSPVGFSTTTDVGSQYGITFGDNTKFDTLSYMVPPGGNTRERNRGRGVFAAGETPSKVNTIEYINIQSMGTAKDFGDLTVTAGNVKGLGSSTRGVFRVDNNPTSRNVLEFITIANTGNSQDFGDLNVAVQSRPGASNQTRGIFSGGLFPGSNVHNDMDYITIATLGNAADFGNLSVSRGDASALASPTRMVVAGGWTPGPTYSDVVDYVTIATTGNAADFGDLNTGKRSLTAVASSTRGVFGPGKAPSVSNVIDFVTIASTGNATDFGDALVARGGARSASNSIRGLFSGGYTPSLINGIEFINIATTGNGADFGDMTFVSQYGGGCSDSHGGIS